MEAGGGGGMLVLSSGVGRGVSPSATPPQEKLPRAKPTPDLVDGRYVISRAAWCDLNALLRVGVAQTPRPPAAQRPQTAPCAAAASPPPHPPRPRALRQPVSLSGLQLVFDAAGLTHAAAAEAEGQDVPREGWRGLSLAHLAGRRRCGTLRLALPEAAHSGVGPARRARERREVEEMRERAARQRRALDEQHPAQHWHAAATRRHEEGRSEARLDALRDEGQVLALDRRAARCAAAAAAAEAAGERRGEARVAAHAERRAAQRAELRRKEEELRRLEVAVAAQVAEEAARRRKREEEGGGGGGEKEGNRGRGGGLPVVG